MRSWDTTCSVAIRATPMAAVFGNIPPMSVLRAQRPAPNGIIHGYREKNRAAYVQDDWKVNSRLTLNLGIRWEYDGSYGDKYGNLTNFWPSQIKRCRPPTWSHHIRRGFDGLCRAQ